MLVGADIVNGAVVALAAIEIGRTGIGFQAHLAVSWKRIAHSPCANLKKLKEANKKDHFMSPDYIRRILAAAPLDMNRVAASAIAALILTGLRREEILQSRHEHLDLEKGSLYLPKTKNGRSRHVVLNDAAIEVFKSAPRMLDSPWIFPGKDPMKPFNNRTKAWHRILTAAKVERCRLHDCRHAFASMLVNEGASLYQVQLLQGPRLQRHHAALCAPCVKHPAQYVTACLEPRQ
jgi:integrase